MLLALAICAHITFLDATLDWRIPTFASVVTVVTALMFGAASVAVAAAGALVAWLPAHPIRHLDPRSVERHRVRVSTVGR